MFRGAGATEGEAFFNVCTDARLVEHMHLPLGHRVAVEDQVGDTTKAPVGQRRIAAHQGLDVVLNRRYSPVAASIPPSHTSCSPRSLPGQTNGIGILRGIDTVIADTGTRR